LALFVFWAKHTVISIQTALPFGPHSGVVQANVVSIQPTLVAGNLAGIVGRARAPFTLTVRLAQDGDRASLSTERQFLTQKFTKQSDSHVLKQIFYYVAPQIKIIIFSQNSLLVLFTPVALVFFFPLWKFYPNKYSYKTCRRFFQTSASQNCYFDK